MDGITNYRERRESRAVRSILFSYRGGEVEIYITFNGVWWRRGVVRSTSIDYQPAPGVTPCPWSFQSWSEVYEAPCRPCRRLGGSAEEKAVRCAIHQVDAFLADDTWEARRVAHLADVEARANVLQETFVDGTSLSERPADLHCWIVAGQYEPVLDHHRNLGSGECTYFIREVGGPYVKIGKSTNGATGRLEGLQTSNARELELLLVLPGGGSLESYLHNAFRASWVRGEWFAYAGRIEAFVSHARANIEDYALRAKYAPRRKRAA